jgi:hypothetical protein
MRTALTAIGYTVLNVRYASLVLPIAAFAFVSSRADTWPWLVWVVGVLVALAVAAELLGSAINGNTAAQQSKAQREYQADMWDKMTKYANGGWAGLDGSEGEAGTPEGQAGPTDEGEGEGGASVPAR